MVNTNENWAIKEKDLRIIDFFFTIYSVFHENRIT